MSSTQSLDSVMADVDASEQDLTNEVETNEPEVSQEAEGATVDDDDVGPAINEQAALHAERQRTKRKYTDTVADFERKFTEATSNFDKKLAERETAINQQWEQRFNQFAQQFQQSRQAADTPVKEEEIDLFDNPQGFVERAIKQALTPLQQETADRLNDAFDDSFGDIIAEHGEAKASEAYQALDRAAKAGDPNAVATVQRVKRTGNARAIWAWHQKTSASQQASEPVIDDAFLAKHGLTRSPQVADQQQRQPQTQQAIPSLNRITAAADNDEEEDDAVEVFNSALRAGVRR